MKAASRSSTGREARRFGTARPVSLSDDQLWVPVWVPRVAGVGLSGNRQVSAGKGQTHIITPALRPPNALNTQ